MKFLTYALLHCPYPDLHLPCWVKKNFFFSGLKYPAVQIFFLVRITNVTLRGLGFFCAAVPNFFYFCLSYPAVPFSLTLLCLSFAYPTMPIFFRLPCYAIFSLTLLCHFFPLTLTIFLAYPAVPFFAYPGMPFFRLPCYAIFPLTLLCHFSAYPAMPFFRSAVYLFFFTLTLLYPYFCELTPYPATPSSCIISFRVFPHTLLLHTDFTAKPHMHFIHPTPPTG